MSAEHMALNVPCRPLIAIMLLPGQERSAKKAVSATIKALCC